jgi:DNA-binding transcriptional LysR family regulator
MALNLHHLRLFTAVVQHDGFSRAAKAISVSQPALSKAVRDLERQIGVALLDRSLSGVTLTAAGAVLYQYARQIFVTEQAAEEELAQVRGVIQGRLAIGASPTIGVYLLPDRLAAFHERHPDIRLFLDIDTTHEIVERLLGTPLDLAFVEGPVADDRLQMTRWQADRLVVIAAAGHSLAHRRDISLAEVLAYPFIGREPDSGTRAIIEQHLAVRGINLPIMMEVGNTEAIKQMVRAGLGLAIVSEAAIRSEVKAEGLASLRIPDLEIERYFWRLQVVGRPMSASAHAFLALLAEELPATGRE